MMHSNDFIHISKKVQYHLKIAGITALIIGTGWYLHKYYSTQDTQDTSISHIINSDTLETIEDNEHKTDDHLNIYKPIIEVFDAIYGMCRIEFNNLIGDETDFEIEMKDKNNNNNNIVLINFNINNIAIDRITNKMYIHLRLPIRLKDYLIPIRIRCKLSNNKWSAFSDLNNINIESSLISKTFQLNEKVTFVPKHSNHGSKGKIIQILDSDCTLYLIEEFNYNLNIKQNHIVHFSRIYRNGPYLYNIIDGYNKIENRIMNKTMFIGNGNGNEYILDIFDILTHIYNKKAQQILIEINEKHYLFIGKFMAKNVTDFLFFNNGKHNLVNCIMEYKHGFIKLVSVWNNSVRNVIELNKMGVNVKVNSNSSYWCDLCGCEISKFDWIYRCDINITDRHFYCLKCVWDIIKQNKQLTQFLKQYLSKYLYHDCIQEISSFVCGSVVYSH